MEGWQTGPGHPLNETDQVPGREIETAGLKPTLFRRAVRRLWPVAMIPVGDSLSFLFDLGIMATVFLSWLVVAQNQRKGSRSS